MPGLLQHLADPSLPEGTTLEGLAQPHGHLRHFSPKRAQDRPVPAQDLEVFEADMTCCQTCFNPPLVFASQFKPSSGGQGESVSTQNVASVHEESPSDQEDQSEGDPPVTVPK